MDHREVRKFEMPANMVWSPNPGSQVLFLTCPVFEALLEGTRGGGKTDSLLVDFAQYCGRGFGENWRGIIFRLSYPQLADIVAKSRRLFYRMFPGIKFNASDYSWHWPTGETLYFRYGATEDDYWNYHGHEYPFIGFEELTNWRSLSFYEAMQSTCRSSFPGMPRMVRATCNPYGVGHGEVKERFDLGTGGTPSGQIIIHDGQKPRVAIHSTIAENTILLANDPEYMAVLRAIKDPNRRAAWLDGSWDIHVGSFLESVWTSDAIVKPFIIPASWKVWRSMDWGYAKPYAIFWFAMDPDGVVYIWREMYGFGPDGKPNVGSRESASRVAEKVKKLEVNDLRMGYEYRMSLADPSISANIGTQNTIAREFRGKGVRWMEAWNAKGSRIAGAQEIIRLLDEGRLKIFDTCKHWLRTVPSIPPSAINPEDVDTEAEDHAWDATRYGIMQRRGAPRDEQKASDPDEQTYKDDDDQYRMKVD